MAKLVILNPNERRRYDSPPVFNADERSLYFSMSNEEMELIQSLRTTSNKIGFAIQLAYFKANGKCFAVEQFRQQDVSYAAKTMLEKLQKDENKELIGHLKYISPAAWMNY